MTSGALRKLAGMAPASLDFVETPERQALRAAVADLGRRYGYAYFIGQARSDGRLTELWREAGRLGFLGVSLPERYGRVWDVPIGAHQGVAHPLAQAKIELELAKLRRRSRWACLSAPGSKRSHCGNGGAEGRPSRDS
jgi:alkylation response protein AidB-like acyl-CoA dehydrogenase